MILHIVNVCILFIRTDTQPLQSKQSERQAQNDLQQKNYPPLLCLLSRILPVTLLAKSYQAGMEGRGRGGNLFCDRLGVTLSIIITLKPLLVQILINSITVIIFFIARHRCSVRHCIIQHQEVKIVGTCYLGNFSVLAWSSSYSKGLRSVRKWVRILPYARCKS